MKTKYLIPFIGAALMQTACVNDLDVMPLDETVMTDEKAYAQEGGFYKGLAKIYSILAISGQGAVDATDISGLDAGNSQLLRSYFNLQVVTTDEAKNAWGDAWAGEINQMLWTDAYNESIEGVYQRSMYIVALANNYIGVVDRLATTDEVRGYRHEARFMRALAYYFLLDCFGNPPFITEGNYSGQPTQIGRAALYEWIEGELTELTELLPETNEYGRATRYAAYALLSRLYLNAEVYTGTAAYDKCVEASNAVIQSAKFGLADDYQSLFIADNDINGAEKEAIFSILFDGQTTQTYGGTTYFVLGSRSANDNDINESGVSTGWGGNRTTAALTGRFDYADNDNPSAATILDRRGIFFDDGRTQEVTVLRDAFGTDGWCCYKFKNIDSNGNPGSNSTFADTDFHLFRLAEMYLNYAEAVVRGAANGNMADAARYVNRLRERGYGDNSHNINESQLTLDFLVEERSREMYWEMTRRTDLIRNGLFTSNSYLWEFKGGVANGTGTDNRMNLFPIPLTDLSVNANLVQNEGY